MGGRNKWGLVTATMALLAGGCRERGATQLLVVVGTNIRLGEGSLERVQITVRDRNGTALQQAEREVLVGGTSNPPFAVTMPFSFAVVPRDDDASQSVRVELTSAWSGQRQISLTAITGFIEGRKLILPMYLQQECVGVLSCGEGRTCVNGDCVSAILSVNDLREPAPGVLNLNDALDGGFYRRDADAAPDVPMDASMDAPTDLGGPEVAMDAGQDSGPEVFDAGRDDGPMLADVGDVVDVSDVLREDVSPTVAPRFLAPASFSYWSTVRPKFRARVVGAASTTTVRGECFRPGTTTASVMFPMERVPQTDRFERVSADGDFEAGPWGCRLAITHNGTTTYTPRRWGVAPSANSNAAGVGWRSYLDMDADGLGDLAIGAQTTANPGTSEVRVQWGHHRVMTGEMPPAMRAFTAGNPGDTLRGPSDIAALGDLNDDGYGDLAVSTGGSRVTVFYGQQSRTATAASFVLRRSGAEVIGKSVAGTDFDGDGFSDIVYSVLDPGSQRAEFAMHFGEVVQRGGDLAPALRCQLPDAPEAVGRVVVAGLGDLNGDGFGDFAVGTLVSMPSLLNVLPVRLYLGATRATPPSCPAAIDVPMPTEPQSGYGLSVAPLGDVDGNGANDLGVLSATSLVVYRRQLIAPDFRTPDVLPLDVTGRCAGSPAGAAIDARLVGVGDLDRDGFHDAAIALPGGCLQLYRGGANGLQFALALQGPESMSMPTFANAASPVGDFDGNNFPDLAVSANLTATASRAVGVIQGNTTAFTTNTVLTWDRREMESMVLFFGEVLGH